MPRNLQKTRAAPVDVDEKLDKFNDAVKSVI